MKLRRLVKLDTSPIYVRGNHPLMFRLYLTFGFIGLGLGLNFLLADLAYNPYHINKIIPGVLFLLYGTGLLIFLLLFRNLNLLRLMMAVSIVGKVFWGTSNLISYVEGNTSFQLAVLYFGLAMLQFWLLVEGSVTIKIEKYNE